MISHFSSPVILLLLLYCCTCEQTIALHRLTSQYTNHKIDRRRRLEPLKVVDDPQFLTDTITTSVDIFTKSITVRVVGALVGNLAAAFAFKVISDKILNPVLNNMELEKRDTVEKLKEMDKEIGPVKLAKKIERKVDIDGQGWLKLFFCLAIDFAGDSSFILPGVGEVEDIAWAPVSAFLVKNLFDSNLAGQLDFAKEILPFSDVVPLATICWSLQYIFPDSPLAKKLNLTQKSKEQVNDER